MPWCLESAKLTAGGYLRKNSKKELSYTPENYKYNLSRTKNLWRRNYLQSMVVQSARIECFRGNSILFPSSGGSKFWNIIWSPIHVAAHSILSLVNGGFPGQPPAQSMVVQSARIACFRGNSILFPSSGGSKFSNIIWSPIHVAAHSILSLVNGHFPGQPPAHWASSYEHLTAS